jgi:heme exporter protein D
MSAFLAMGGYAWYVWMAYGACALVVAIESVAVRARHRRALAAAREAGLQVPAPAGRYDPARST